MIESICITKARKHIFFVRWDHICGTTPYPFTETFYKTQIYINKILETKNRQTFDMQKQNKKCILFNLITKRHTTHI